MKVVRTFSTSANLGPGFDTLGICFNVYNEYYFYKNDKYDLVGYDEQYQSEKSNLIISSYEYVFKKLNKQIVYLYLEQLTQNIPNSRGLGSSASCIVAGVMIANDILGKCDHGKNGFMSKDCFHVPAKVKTPLKRWEVANGGSKRKHTKSGKIKRYAYEQGMKVI